MSCQIFFWRAKVPGDVITAIECDRQAEGDSAVWNTLLILKQAADVFIKI